MIDKQFLWVEKYRPNRIADCILPGPIKSTFQGFVDQRNIPNLLLAGPPGGGKTTIALAMLKELDCNYIMINGSLKGNIDTLRNEIQNFASSVSFNDSRKYVILDEADFLTNAVQPALRNFMEMFSENCGFILTANYRNKIIDALQSRCSVIDFNISKDDAPVLAGSFLKRVIEILEAEKIRDYDKAAVAALIRKHYPDWRRVLNELQRFSRDGKLDVGILSDGKNKSIKELIEFMKDKNFSAVRQWSAAYSGSDFADIYREFYDSAPVNFKTSFVPALVLLISKYMAQSNMVFDQEINFVAFCVEVMVEAEWQK